MAQVAKDQDSTVQSPRTTDRKVQAWSAQRNPCCPASILCGSMTQETLGLTSPGIEPGAEQEGSPARAHHQPREVAQYAITWPHPSCLTTHSRQRPGVAPQVHPHRSAGTAADTVSG